MINEQLQADVVAELFWDPKVRIQRLAVAADAGTVTLRGAVDTFRAKREAGKAAGRVYGVTQVHNELDVWLLDDSKRDNAELRGDVLQALMLDGLIPTTVDARARNGFVTLSGTADWHCQRDEAEVVAASVPGVTAVQNHIRLTPAPDTGDAKKDISEAFRRNASLDADRLSIDTTCYGRVALTGTVSSWAEHDEAVAAAWSAPGITEVDDQILVAY
jgi:osmotically-inducible protein OsmY